MVQYVFKSDEIVAIKNAKDADAQTIGEELDKIRRARGGELMPTAVVEAARDPAHPLHGFFEWDDSRAAEAYRLDQARAIIRLVRIDDIDPDEPPRAFLSIGSDRGTSYRSFDDVKASADLRDAVLRQAEKDLEAFQRRYRSLKDVLGFVEKAKQAVQEHRRRLGPYESRASA